MKFFFLMLFSNKNKKKTIVYAAYLLKFFLYKYLLKKYSEIYSCLVVGLTVEFLVMNMTHGDVLYVSLFDPLVPTSA